MLILLRLHIFFFNNEYMLHVTMIKLISCYNIISLAIQFKLYKSQAIYTIVVNNYILVFS